MPSVPRPIAIMPITTRTLEVLRVTDVTPGMRRVTLGGPELAAHVAANGAPVAAFRSDGFDDECKILLPQPGETVAVGPEQADGVLRWPRHDPRLLFRTYTIRRWDAARGEVDIDFAQHGVGPATAWARRARPGDRLQIAGPKSSSPHPVGVDWTLIAGDETALPAIARCLEQWPEGARGRVIVETARAADRQDLAVPGGVVVQFVDRATAGDAALFDAIRAAEWWTGDAFAWVAGEASAIAPIRRWLRTERGLPKDRVEVTGYWRRQAVVARADDPELPDAEASTDAGEAFHELTELLPAMSLRVAATIGLGAALDGRSRTLDALVAATGAHPRGLAKLLRHLASVGVVETGADGSVALTPLGGGLDDEDEVAELDLDGPRARRELLGALSLLGAVRTGRGVRPRWLDEDVLAGADAIATRVEDGVEDAVYTAAALTSAAGLDDAGTVLVVGHGAGAQARALVEAHPRLVATVVAAPSELAAMRAAGDEHPRVRWRAGSAMQAQPDDADAVLLVQTLRALPDVDAVHLLRSAAESVGDGRPVLLFEDLLDPARASDHDYADDLLDLALTGGGARDRADCEALIAAAGLVVTRSSTVGWGSTLLVLTRSRL